MAVKPLLKGHSKRGASNAARWMNCPGSEALIAVSPPDLGNEAAATGTLAHEIAAAMLQGKDLVPYSIESVHVVDGFKIKVTADMMDAVWVYVHHVNQLIEEYDLKPHQIGIERELSIPGVATLKGDDDLWGTADCTLYIPYTKLIVLDYKHGFKKVETDNNAQLKFYALGAFLSLPEDEQGDIDTVEVVIVQPRPTDGGVFSVTLTTLELLQFHKELRLAVAAIQPGAPTKAGPWCDYCQAQLICPSFNQKQMEIIGVDYRDVAPVNALPEPANLSLEQLENIVLNQSAIEKFMERAASEFQRRLELGDTSKNFKLVVKTGHRKWINEDETIRVLKPIINVYVDPKLKSPNQMEQALKAAGAVTTAVKTLSYTPELGVTVDKMGSRRPAIQAGQLNDYINVEQVTPPKHLSAEDAG